MVRLRVGVGKDDAVQWVSVAVFGSKAVAAAAELKKGDRCYIEGNIRVDAWRGSDGVERDGLSVAAFKCERTHNIGRNRPKKDDRGVSVAGGSTGPDRSTAAQGGGGDFHNDEIPF